MPHIVAIIQARTSSSRLPNKVLLDIAGQPMLVRVVERTQLAKTIDQVVIATTDSESDDAIVELCTERGYPCYRGSEFDVLDRYYQAAVIFHADVIVRITADCPVIDPQLIDQMVITFLGNKKPTSFSHEGKIAYPYDFAANRLPLPWGRSYPIGLDTEICTFDALELAWREAAQPHQREHVMPFFYEQPERFRILHVTHDPDYGSKRWTVDTADDLKLLRQIYTHFSGRDNFSWLEIVDLFEKHPELEKINAQVHHKDYRDTDARISSDNKSTSK
jgi:spore coat polysaccharide biosynthesis protein SpsF